MFYRRFIHMLWNWKTSMTTTHQPNDDELVSAKRALAIATEALASRVSSLADAVETNNREIQRLRSEVNQKPDDAEVKAITGMAANDRRATRNKALATAVVSALLSGAVAFAIADYRSDHRCQENRDTIAIITDFLDTVPNPRPELVDTAKKLRVVVERPC